MYHVRDAKENINIANHLKKGVFKYKLPIVNPAPTTLDVVPTVLATLHFS
jgi:hypothetical protein